MYKEFDRENMFGAIWDFPENLIDALKLGNEITLSQSYIEIQNIVVDVTARGEQGKGNSRH